MLGQSVTVKRRALTFLEVVCSVTIIAALAAIVAPVLSGTVLAAKQSASVHNLRQIHHGMMLYREANDPKIEFGRPSQMGLPPNPIAWNRSGGWRDAVPEPRTWQSPCRPGVGVRRFGEGKPYFTDYFVYMDELPGEHSTFEAMCILHGAQTVYVAEPWCDASPNDPEANEWRARRATGLRLDGSIQTRTRDASVTDLDAWWY
ncbi:MAG: hypothetical protein IT207_03510 [Fimbriimonadaceae bacterium]|nr:hypothetical protein [Fimbriimonadaceae bacterium]